MDDRKLKRLVASRNRCSNSRPTAGGRAAIWLSENEENGTLCPHWHPAPAAPHTVHGAPSRFPLEKTAWKWVTRWWVVFWV
ncbi:unnamed protein product, partial [Mesorhabditis spiculigera]